MSPLAHSVAPGNVAGLRATLPAHREEAGQEPRKVVRELQRKSLGLAALDDIKVQRSSTMESTAAAFSANSRTLKSLWTGPPSLLRAARLT